MKKFTVSVVVMMLAIISVFAQNLVLWDSVANSLPTDTTLIKSGVVEKKAISTIKHVFYDRSNPNDSESAKITTSNAELGISDAVNAKNSIKASPNPANDEVKFSFSLIPGSSGKIIILQITGTVISENPIQGTHGNFVLTTREIKDGLYFYYLMVNGEVYCAKKFVVRHL